jgi:hypothetical protein
MISLSMGKRSPSLERWTGKVTPGSGELHIKGVGQGEWKKMRREMSVL